MAENNNQDSKFKKAFQYAAAFLAPLGCEAPQQAFAEAGAAYDYVKTWIGAHRAPKLT